MNPEKIGILGTGNVGSALSKGLARAGYEVFAGSRNPDKQSAVSLKEFHQSIAPVSYEDAIHHSDTIIISLVPSALEDIYPILNKAPKKIVIDAMNTVGRHGNDTVSTTTRLMQNTSHKIVKCFNTTGAENLEDPAYASGGIDMFMAGDDEEAKKTARKLALDLGFHECHDFGNSQSFELLESLAKCWIQMAVKNGMGRNIGFRILSKNN